MKRHTFLVLCPVDCADPVAVVVEQTNTMTPLGYLHDSYRLVSFPNQCKCKALIHIAEPSQDELRDAWDLEEAEDV